ncbi:hypothetical protein RBSH_05184 [Rhodopirellula baltica SH28]|uniref:Uncharacterized protein n=1 Tax=Rhodopirellula baltica SH28 TaxID=993517 RepID=K5C8Q8_RHOBT|nr:hypothetical protein RBSH_05184 [Rhodopirellula baltica SH28]
MPLRRQASCRRRLVFPRPGRTGVILPENKAKTIDRDPCDQSQFN